MGQTEIVVENRPRRKRVRRKSLSGKQRAAALFKLWHGLRELMADAERLREGELVHFLAITQMLVEEKATEAHPDAAAFRGMDTSLVN
ncbi:MAG TPA: hypothetical protein VMI56_12525 [Reyranella sp.]|nr:hypothetical protein [Reyranella sp.]